MTNITTYLNNIKNAVFGKDVRDSIHDAIKQCYDDASTKGNANMEVTLARGEYNNLNERLDNHSSQIKDIETNNKSCDTQNIFLKMFNGEPVKIVCKGDSTTFGYGVGGVQVAKPYPQILQERLQYIYNNPNITVVNKGVSGSTSRHGLQTFRQDVINANADMVIIIYGLNDTDQSLPIKTFKDNYRQMIDMAKKSNIKVVLANSTFMTKNNNSNNINEHLKVINYAKTVEELALENNVEFVDLNKEFTKLMKNNAIDMRLLPDTVHPYGSLSNGTSGYQLIADILITKSLCPNYQTEYSEGQYLSFKSPFLINTVTKNYDNKGSKLYYGYILEPTRQNEKLKFLVYNNNPNNRLCFLSYKDYNVASFKVKNFNNDYATLNLTNAISQLYDGVTEMNLGIGLHCFEINASDVVKMFAPSGFYITSVPASNVAIETPTLQNNWVNFGNGYATPRLIKEGNIIYVEGVIKNGTLVDGTTLFTLPAGFRPKNKIIISTAASNGAASFQIATDGSVQTFNCKTGLTWLSINCMFSLN